MQYKVLRAVNPKFLTTTTIVVPFCTPLLVNSIKKFVTLIAIISPQQNKYA